MYTNTSPEKIRECLAKANIKASSVRAIDAYPPFAATLFRACIPDLGMLEIMDRLKDFDKFLAKVHRRVSTRCYMYYSRRHRAWIVNIPVFLDKDANNAE